MIIRYLKFPFLSLLPSLCQFLQWRKNRFLDGMIPYLLSNNAINENSTSKRWALFQIFLDVVLARLSSGWNKKRGAWFLAFLTSFFLSSPILQTHSQWKVASPSNYEKPFQPETFRFEHFSESRLRQVRDFITRLFAFFPPPNGRTRRVYRDHFPAAPLLSTFHSSTTHN